MSIVFDLLNKAKTSSKAKATQLEADSAQANTDKDLEHLTASGELPWGWLSANHEFTDKISNQYSVFLNTWLNSRGKSPQEQLNALASFVRFMNDVKLLCEKKGECFDLWRKIQFDDVYLEKRADEFRIYSFKSRRP